MAGTTRLELATSAVTLSDEELVKFGKQVRSLSEPRVGVTPDPWKAQLQEARAKWRRRHPKAQ